MVAAEHLQTLDDGTERAAVSGEDARLGARPEGDGADDEGSPPCAGLGDSSSESDGEEERDVGPGERGSADGKNRRVSGVTALTGEKGKTAADIEAEARRLGGGFVHYGGDVYCKSMRRGTSDAFDLTFHLFDESGRYYQFRDCDATGRFAPGKVAPLLRSKVAVARYLERDGKSSEAGAGTKP